MFDANGTHIYDIREANPWIAVVDGLLGEIPVLGMFTGYFLNPSYLITNMQDETVFELKKTPSLMERRFGLEKQAQSEHDELVTLSCMMLMLLERSDG